MDVYHSITPVRSVQQSINLIRSLKNKKKEEVSKTRVKTMANGSITNIAESYGAIPNLRNSSIDTATSVKLSSRGSARQANSSVKTDLMNNRSVSPREIKDFRSYQE